GGEVAGEREQVLDRDGNAGERRRRRATGANAVVKIHRRERVRGMDFEKNALPFSRLIRDPRQALFDQAAAFTAAGEFGFELGERWHCLGASGRQVCLERVEMPLSMTYQPWESGFIRGWRAPVLARSQCLTPNVGPVVPPRIPR